MYSSRSLTKKLGLIITMVVASAFFGSCEQYVFDPPELDPDAEISFAESLVPFFSAKCAGCHGGGINPDLREANAFASLVTDANPATKYVNTGSPETSLIYSKLSQGSHATIATDIEKQKLLKWIQDGALNN